MTTLANVSVSFLAVALLWGCGDASENPDPGGVVSGAGASGGTFAHGGNATDGTGGMFSSGGADGNGGAVSSGGVVGSGGVNGTGASTGSGGADGSGGSDVVLDADLTVLPETKFQTIDGFGAALPMWGSQSGMWTTDEVRKFVGLGAGEIGLSIVRTIIDPDSSRWPFAVASLKEAKAYGEDVQILASPWSPPAHMKDNNSTVGGGKLKTDDYDDYANHLNDYVQFMSGESVTIDVVSVQNEPDWHPDYDSCDWNGTSLMTFVKNNAPAIVGPKIMIAESLQFTRSYTDPSLNDATAVNNFDLIGGHIYGAEASGKLSAYPLAEQKGKNIWMTEYNFHEADGSGASIWSGDNQAVWDETLDEILDTVDKSMRANWSAYVWWWGRRYYSFVGDGDAAFGTTKGTVLKRGYAFGQFSKFVRPGYSRVDVSEKISIEAINTTAYVGNDEVVLVLLNMSEVAFNDVVIDIPHPVTKAQAYITSRSENQATALVTPENHYATVASVPARSIVTVVMSY